MSVAADIVGKGVGLAKGLFGESSEQEQQQQQSRFTEFRPEDIAAIQRQQALTQAGTQQFQGLANQLAQQAQGLNLQTQFGGPGAIRTTDPQFSQQLDPFSRALAAQGQQALGQQAAAQRRQLASQFRGQPGISRALQAQTDIQSRLQANPLLLQAAQQQQQRELGQAQAQTAAAQQATQAQLAQAAQAAQFQQAANQALLQQQQARQGALGLSGAGLQAQQGLLAQLSQLGQQFGTERISGTAQAKGRQGGLF